VSTPSGTSAVTLVDHFTYLASPTLTGISPSSGPTSGGTPVTITGTAFSGATAVHFGAAPATAVVVDSATHVTAVAPPAGAGTAEVTVTTSGGTSALTVADRFTYVGLPAVSTISPDFGPTVGGTSVTITGTGFSGATAVAFGVVPAASFTVNSATSISATSPAGIGTAEVTVVTPSGTSPDIPADRFSYGSVPAVDSVSPASGPLVGGTSVIITGADLTGATAVAFGATAATSFTVNSLTQVTAVAPAGTGTVNLTVTTAGGTSPTSAADQFTYASLPSVISTSPSSGLVAGGTSVTIVGANLCGASAVDFGASASTAFSVDVSCTQLTATAPAGTGTVEVTVTTPGGISLSTVADRFTYLSAPAVTEVGPSSGLGTGGTLVTVTGSGFTDVSAVAFGVVPATGVVVDSSAQLTATAPAGTATVDITVVTPLGASPTTSADHFTYTVSPTPPASTTTTTTTTPPSSSHPAPGQGYWMVAGDGGVFSFGNAQFYGSEASHPLNASIVAIVGTIDHHGYWLFAADGGVFTFGDAVFYGSLPEQLGSSGALAAPIVAAAGTPDAKGYWLFAADGGVFTFGDAVFYGSLPGQHVVPDQPITAGADSPDGHGYWLAGADGGMFAFGDAGFHGSIPGTGVPAASPVIATAGTPTGGGYWVVAASGGAMTFGDAGSYGSMIAASLGAPVVGLASSPDGHGYWMFGADGGVFTFGDTTFYGSMSGTSLALAVVGGTGW
jgi:hypothetical protein